MIPPIQHFALSEYVSADRNRLSLESLKEEYSDTHRLHVSSQNRTIGAWGVVLISTVGTWLAKKSFLSALQAGSRGYEPKR